MEKYIPYLLVVIMVFQACQNDDMSENEPEGEAITDVRLIFTPVEGGEPLVFGASDNGGVNDLQPDGPVILNTNTSYQLFIQLENLTTNEDITDVVEEQGDKHMFFFEFTEDVFTNPSGVGNLDKREPQTVEYQDTDHNGQPVGVITAWVTGEQQSGTFRVLLKHQPDSKSDTSTSKEGSVDLDVTWQILIE